MEAQAPALGTSSGAVPMALDQAAQRVGIPSQATPLQGPPQNAAAQVAPGGQVWPSVFWTHISGKVVNLGLRAGL
jgi:hypothetical protein